MANLLLAKQLCCEHIKDGFVTVQSAARGSVSSF